MYLDCDYTRIVLHPSIARLAAHSTFAACSNLPSPVAKLRAPFPELSEIPCPPGLVARLHPCKIASRLGQPLPAPRKSHAADRASLRVQRPHRSARSAGNIRNPLGSLPSLSRATDRFALGLRDEIVCALFARGKPPMAVGFYKSMQLRRVASRAAALASPLLQPGYCDSLISILPEVSSRMLPEVCPSMTRPFRALPSGARNSSFCRVV